MLIRILMKTVLNKIFLLCLFLESLSGYTQNLAIGEWRIEVPYTSAKNVTLGKGEVFAAMNIFYVGHVLDGAYTVKYETLNGLSDINVSGVYYNQETDLLFVAYDNANIDLIENNTVYNISDIKRSTAANNKRINDVFFYENLAYLSCAFGIVVVDLEKKEIKESYFIGNDGNQVEVFATTINNNKIYAATAIGVQVVSLDAPNLVNFQLWEIQGINEGINATTATDIAAYNNEVFAVINDSVFKQGNNNWEYFYANNDTLWLTENITVSNNKLLICERKVVLGTGSRVKMYDGQNITEPITEEAGLPFVRDALMLNDSTFYVAELYGNGLCRVINNKFTSLNPNSVPSTIFSDIAFTKDFAWIASGTNAGTDLFNQRGLHRAQNNFWYNIDQYNTPALADFPNLFTIETSPFNNHIFVGSHFAGIIELDEDGIFIDTFSIYNTTMENAVGNPRCLVSDIQFDKQGNMWVTNYRATNYLQVRKPDGTWKAFKPSNNPNTVLAQKILIDDNNQKWIYINNSNTEGIVVFSEGNDMESAADDKSIVLQTGAGRGNLPNNNVLCMAKDLDGELWVGTAEGLVVFYCAGSVLTSQGCDAQEILVTAPDGFVGALLGTERVQAIAVDGANRKWIGTTNGLWLFSPDGTRQIEYFTAENSPLLSNNITTLAIEPASGILYIGTDKGILLYRSDATEGNETIECGNKVFPNPVRENYFGPIAVSCLPQNADIKITDVAGNLVFKTTALGGQAVWDGRHPNGDYAKAGVYLVFASNADGSTKQVSKILVMR